METQFGHFQTFSCNSNKITKIHLNVNFIFSQLIVLGQSLGFQENRDNLGPYGQVVCDTHPGSKFRPFLLFFAKNKWSCPIFSGLVQLLQLISKNVSKINYWPISLDIQAHLFYFCQFTLVTSHVQNIGSVFDTDFYSKTRRIVDQKKSSYFLAYFLILPTVLFVPLQHPPPFPTETPGKARKSLVNSDFELEKSVKKGKLWCLLGKPRKKRIQTALLITFYDFLRTFFNLFFAINK